MTLEKGEEALIRIPYREFSHEQIAVITLLITKMEAHNGFRDVAFNEVKQVLAGLGVG